MATYHVISNEDTTDDAGHQMDIGANVEHEHSTSNRKRYVRGCGPKTIKSRRGKWVEEDMTMDPADTTNDCIEQEDKVLGLKFTGAPTSSLEDDDNLSDDTSNKNMCTYTYSEDEDFIKTSNRTRTTLKMHNLPKDIIGVLRSQMRPWQQIVSYQKRTQWMTRDIRIKFLV